MSYLKKHGVEWNALTTLNSANVDHPLEVYRFLRDECGAQFIQFIPIVERMTVDQLPLTNEGWGERTAGKRPLYTQAGACVTDRSVTAEQYGAFLIGIFEEWVRHDVGQGLCADVRRGAGQLVGRAFGAVRVLQDLRPGAGPGAQRRSLFLRPLCGARLSAGQHQRNAHDRAGGVAKQRKFGQDKLDTLPQYCRDCDVRFACHGGCPKDRFIETPDGEPGLNYLCAGYKVFFHHVDQPMRIMKELLKQNRAPAEIMRWYAAQDAQLQEAFAKAGRNDPCPCGSGKKFKQCHGRRAGDS